MSTHDTIDHTTLTHLVEAGAVRAAHAIGQSGGWAVVVKYGMVERALTASRSKQVRLFKKLETLVEYLKGIGISRFDVDAAEYDPATTKTVSRPDRSAALKAAHEAAAYDKYFRAAVQDALDDPRAGIPHAQVKTEFAGKRAALLKRVGKGG